MASPRFLSIVIRLSSLLLLLVPAVSHAQGTRADYERADSFNARTQGLVLDVAEAPTWIGETSRFWYRKSVEGGNAFVLVDAATQDRGPAFDHDRLAASLSTARDTAYTGVMLPFRGFTYEDEDQAIEFVLSVAGFGGRRSGAAPGDSTWRCNLSDYRCENMGPVPVREGRGRSIGYQAGPGQLWRTQGEEPLESPNEEWEAFIQNYNVAVRRVGEEEYTLLSNDGSEGNTYTHASMVWSPDSKKLAVDRVIPVHQREVHYVASSPEDQLQPKHSTLIYAKPGDVLDKEQPVVFDVEAQRQIQIDDALFPNAYALSDLEWREDGRRITFEYNQRGHQVYRIIEIDANTGATRAVISGVLSRPSRYEASIFRFGINSFRTSRNSSASVGQETTQRPQPMQSSIPVMRPCSLPCSQTGMPISQTCSQRWQSMQASVSILMP